MSRRIWLCADDYGIAPGVDRAIRDLVARDRINAVSVMVVAPSFDADAARALTNAANGRPVALGLHLTLSAPFAGDEAFLPVDRLLATSLRRGLHPAAIESELARQLAAFERAFGRAPDFLDGHQHVHVFPQIRDAVLDLVAQAAPRAWVRQCGRASRPLHRRLQDKKGLLLDLLSHGFRRRAAAAGVKTNPAFAGTYDFDAGRARPYGARFASFLDGLPDGGVIMCHPGEVDDELVRLDSLTTLREEEYAWFAGDAFASLLRDQGVAEPACGDPSLRRPGGARAPQ